ncbi:MAG: uroporphyrinogen decarboxylase [Puniceicoccaceae bacterium]
MNSRQRFLDALACENRSRPPVWLMRQAGRYLPEYRALKEKHSFRTLVRTPDLAAEVTLQPLSRFPLLDAAILFSDILVIPEALGVDYRFRDQGGIELERTIRSDSDLDGLEAEGAAERLAYVGEALGLLRAALAGERALLGFCGAPWTLALYLVEGGSPGEGANLREMLHRRPAAARRLLATVTTACLDYVRLQCAAGADAIQVFDSWAGLCPAGHYAEWCLEPIRRIREACSRPLILFSRGAGGRLAEQARTGAEALGIDWATPLDAARETVGPALALQGNLDPLLLETDPGTVRASAGALLRARAGDPGYILNCGHGLSPRTRIECVEALLEAAAAAPP